MVHSIKHSIVVICFNQEKTICDALKSVLGQTEQPFELVVLDDCSVDQTAEVAQSFLEDQTNGLKWRVIKNIKNLGIAKNTKKIQEVMMGNVITHLSGDDRLDPRAVEITNKLIKENKFDPDKDLFISVSPTKLFYKDRSEIRTYKILRGSISKSIIRKTIPFVKIGCSKNVFLKVHYPTDMGAWGDWYWDVSICMQQSLKYYEINTPLYWYSVGVGVGSRLGETSLRNSYLQTAIQIFQKFHDNMTFFDRQYLLGEIAYLRGELSGYIPLKIYAFMLYLFNAATCQDMMTFKSLTIRYIPSYIYPLIKNIKR